MQPDKQHHRKASWCLWVSGVAMAIAGYYLGVQGSWWGIVLLVLALCFITAAGILALG